MHTQKRTFDYLVVGSGIAGLFYALKVIGRQPSAQIAIVTKKEETASSTNWAQGGIAAVLSGTDSVDSHVADTLKVGCGLCHADVVRKVVESSPKAIDELINYGVRFTFGQDGALDLGREGGHTHNRVAHASDLTGMEIERALLSACRGHGTVEFFRDHMVVDLVKSETPEGVVCGGAKVYSEEKSELEHFLAPVTMLATGGLGQVYFHTSNPRIATGDGVAIAFRAGVPVANLEFVQFHPTTLFAPGRWPFLISEAVRGEGGILKTVSGKRVMKGVHPLEDLAPRDVVARAIDRELKASGEDYVLLDVSHLDGNFVKERFPNIYKECMKYGFDITARPIPVVPAAHYSCGGVLSTIQGETELPGLYVAGEVAMSGMHGANRLASNSLLEAVVMANFAAETSQSYYERTDSTWFKDEPEPRTTVTGRHHEKVYVSHDRREIQHVMSDLVGIVRTVKRLELALDKVRTVRRRIDEYFPLTPTTHGLLELRNIATVAELIIQSALRRKESRGLHYLEDMPEQSDEFLHDTIISPQSRPEYVS